MHPPESESTGRAGHGRRRRPTQMGGLRFGRFLGLSICFLLGLRGRLHAEIKRRIRSAGAFPDRASALRLITAVALRTTEVWSEHRYLDVSLLEPKEVAKAA